MANSLPTLCWHSAFSGSLLLNGLIVAFDVTKGIERVSKILMPLLFFMMLAIIIRGLMLPGAWAGVEFLFKFDPQAFTFSALLRAMGFTFFSLCVGCGCMMTYGSYLMTRPTCSAPAPGLLSFP